MRFLFFLALVIHYKQAKSQPSRKILDEKTNLPVPYVTIKVLHSPKGIIAADNGEFELPIEKSDTVLFSCVGYNQIILTGEKIGAVIYLAPKIKSLPEAIIGSKKLLQTLLLGSRIKKPDKDINFGPGSDLKEEFAQKIELPDSTFTYKLKKVYMPVEKRPCYGPLLVRIYAEDTSSIYPGEELLMKFVDVDDKDIKKKVLEIDLTDANIYFHQCKSFFVSFGWTTIKKLNPHRWCVTTILLTRASTELTYTRYLTNNNYNWFPAGHFRDLNGVPYQAKTTYSVEVDEMK